MVCGDRKHFWCVVMNRGSGSKPSVASATMATVSPSSVGAQMLPYATSKPRPLRYVGRRQAIASLLNQQKPSCAPASSYATMSVMPRRVFDHAAVSNVANYNGHISPAGLRERRAGVSGQRPRQMLLLQPPLFKHNHQPSMQDPKLIRRWLASEPPSSYGGFRGNLHNCSRN